MLKYLIKRLIFGIFAIIAAMAIVMLLIYTFMDRDLVFAKDPMFTRQTSNARFVYMYTKWEEYGYLDYVPYTEWLQDLANKGEIDEETRSAAAAFGRTPEEDSEVVQEYAARFIEDYQSQGYSIVRKDAELLGGRLAAGGAQVFFAHRDIPLLNRLFSYLGSFITVDSIHYSEREDPAGVGVENPGVTFTLHDPVYGGKKFSPAIIGNGTEHKYLLYFTSDFPFIHQNIATIKLGTSYTVNKGVDVFATMTQSQGSYVLSDTTFPTGLQEQAADNLHEATYSPGSLATGGEFLQARYTDDYTNVDTIKQSYAKLGFSFVIGIIAVVVSYLLGVPMGILMALRKDGLIDKLGTMYVIFISAVPSLAYIFMFRAIGDSVFHLPTTFDLEKGSKLMYVLPMISLALPQAAGTMKWLRRYMIDQMNSDYVKFARSGGLTEGEIFRKHILKNAAIPIFNGIPGSIIFAMTGAIITERLYSVPGAGGLLTDAIAAYDNGVIVGMALFYSALSVISMILGDILMAVVDPRISFTEKAR